jgi:16S rRNA (uracil1498-N3)-methyltransferase
MRRFFLGNNAVSTGEIVISGELFRHMARVLRMKAGAEVLLVDSGGAEYHGTIATVSSRELVVTLIEGAVRNETETGPAITLYQALPKGDKLELILQKATELGVNTIVPFAAARSVARHSDTRGSQKLERWQKIVLEAARQSGRSIIPEVAPAGSLAELLQHAEQSVRLMLWEDEQDNRFRSAVADLPAPGTIAVLVGPEGGFTPEEVNMAREKGFIPLTLGKRILRTETAGLAMLAILQYRWGDLG